MTVYLIAVETKMYLEMLHMEMQGPSTDQAWTKHGPSMDQAWTKHRPSMDQAQTKHGPSMDTHEKWENFDLSVGLTVDTWELLSCE